MEKINNCQHIWQIEPANGKSSKGICSNCGNSKDFLNYIVDTIDSFSWRKNSKAKKLEKETQEEIL